jgi:hypothetical protein
MYTCKLTVLILVASVSVLAAPHPIFSLESLQVRAAETVNPDAVTGTKCIDPAAYVKPLHECDLS